MLCLIARCFIGLSCSYLQEPFHFAAPSSVIRLLLALHCVFFGGGGGGAEEEVERTGEKCDATARRRSLKQAGCAHGHVRGSARPRESKPSVLSDCLTFPSVASIHLRRTKQWRSCRLFPPSPLSEVRESFGRPLPFMPRLPLKFYVKKTRYSHCVAISRTCTVVHAHSVHTAADRAHSIAGHKSQKIRGGNSMCLPNRYPNPSIPGFTLKDGTHSI